MYELFEPVENIDGILSGLSFLVWVWAAVGATGLAWRPSNRTLRRRARWLRWLLWIGAAMAVARFVLFGLMWTVDWLFAEPRVLVSLPVLALPLAVVIMVARPGLRRLTAPPDAPDQVPDAPTRSAAADPRIVVPFQVMAVAALVAAYAAYVSRPVPPYLGDVLTHLGPLVVAAVICWGVAVLRRRSVSQPESPAYRSLARRMLRSAAAAAVVAVAAAGLIGMAAVNSRLPDRMSMMDHGNLDWGGGQVGDSGVGESGHHGGVNGATVGVETLTGPRTGEPDHRFTLTAEQGPIRLSSGTVVPQAWTYNGTAPGPELRVRQGDLVEVTLVNRLPDEGVTIHWHGLDIPNAEDGVAGVTQDAVQPGGSHVYRFRADQVGTFWYHTHQSPLWSIRRGLFGALVIEPPAPTEDTDIEEADLTVMAHEWRVNGERVPSFGTADAPRWEQISPGTPVRLRLVNTDNNPSSDTEGRAFTLVGTPFRVSAIDGVDLSGPTELTDARLVLAAGGRYDLTFTMPDRPVRLADLGSEDVSLGLSPDGSRDLPAVPAELSPFDPGRYGVPAGTPFGPASRFDRAFTQLLDDRLGFFDGGFHFLPTINGASFPHTPTLMVREGDLVKVLIVNRSHQNHPMHLHGHHALVLSHNREPVTGSPWWVDSLDVRPGETYEIAFRADNPGLWMDHCHNLDHAANGMVMHLAYEGFHSPFEVGRATPNQPE